MHADLLAHAIEIGQLVADAGIEDGGAGVYWRSASHIAQKFAGSSNLYLGNAGICVFLAHLYVASGDPRFHDLAQRGMRWALEPR